MSEENVEIVRRTYEGFLEGLERGYFGGGFDTGLVAEDFELVLEPEFALVEGKVWRGREGYDEFLSLGTRAIRGLVVSLRATDRR